MPAESQHTEWKVAWHDDHLRWVCGFANAEGGRLEIGRNDEGYIVGLADAAKLLEDLPNKIRDVLGILVAVNLRETDGRAWLEIVVDPYPNPINLRGRYYQRIGSTLQELRGALGTACRCRACPPPTSRRPRWSLSANVPRGVGEWSRPPCASRTPACWKSSS